MLTLCTVLAQNGCYINDQLGHSKKIKYPKLCIQILCHKLSAHASRRAAENERRLIKGVGILIFWSYLINQLSDCCRVGKVVAHPFSKYYNH